MIDLDQRWAWGVSSVAGGSVWVGKSAAHAVARRRYSAWAEAAACRLRGVAGGLVWAGVVVGTTVDDGDRRRVAAFEFVAPGDGLQNRVGARDGGAILLPTSDVAAIEDAPSCNVSVMTSGVPFVSGTSSAADSGCALPLRSAW
jgi:hypothetical protein